MLTFIIPTFNRAEFVERLLNSLLQQTSRRFRIVVRDNQSTDGSVEVISKWSNAHPDIPIALFSAARNEGALSNFRALLELVPEGPVQFLDTEDFLSPDYVENVTRVLQSDAKVDVVIPQFFEAGMNGVIRKLCLYPTVFNVLPPSRLSFLLTSPEVSGVGYVLYAAFVSPRAVQFLRDFLKHISIFGDFSAADNSLGYALFYDQSIQKYFLPEAALFHTARVNVDEDRLFRMNNLRIAYFHHSAPPEEMERTIRCFLEYSKPPSFYRALIEEMIQARVNYLSSYTKFYLATQHETGSGDSIVSAPRV